MEQFTFEPKPLIQTSVKARIDFGVYLEPEEQNNSPLIGTYHNTLEKHGTRTFCFVCNQYLKKKNVNHFEQKLHREKLGLVVLKNSDLKHLKSFREVPSEPIFSEAYIQERLNNFHSAPLVGLEYLIEIVGKKMPTYICALCLDRFCARKVIHHLISKPHKTKYMRVYFPAAFRKIQSFGSITNRYGFNICLDKVIQLAEEVFGRLKPMQVQAEKYKYYAFYYLHLIRNGNHHRESGSHVFENLFDTTFFRELRSKHKGRLSRKRHKNDKSVSKFLKLYAGEQKMREKNILILKYETDTTSSLVKAAMQYAENARKRELLQPVVTDSHDTKGDDQCDDTNIAIQQGDFNKLIKVIDEKMEQEFRKYKENPELHPRHDKEWVEFLKKRCLELKGEGKDPLTYDFEPEWKKIWDELFLKLHQEKIESKKAELRKTFELDGLMPGNFSEVVPTCEISEDFTDTSSKHKDMPGDEPSKLRKRSRSREDPCEISNSQRTKERKKDEDLAQLQKNDQDHKYPVDDIPADKVRIIEILRQLAAVEKLLGSLGPKVVDLMSQALIMENKNANSSEELLENEVNCILLETTKEKLKGKLEASLIESDEQQLIHKIIDDIERCISVSLQRGKKNEGKLHEKFMVWPGFGLMDKEKVLEQIVNSLLSQGKKNVTQEELEQLIKESIGEEPTKQSILLSYMEKIVGPQWSGSKFDPTKTPKPVPKPTYTEILHHNNISETDEEINNFLPLSLPPDTTNPYNINSNYKYKLTTPAYNKYTLKRKLSTNDLASRLNLSSKLLRTKKSGFPKHPLQTLSNLDKSVGKNLKALEGEENFESLEEGKYRFDVPKYDRSNFVIGEFREELEDCTNSSNSTFTKYFRYFHY